MYKLISPRISRCLQCGEPIYGRPDKKFCDAGCRNTFHNREAAAQRRYHNYVLEALEVNYTVLTELINEGKRSIPYEEAVGRGFNPDFITGIHKKYRLDDYSVFDITYNQSDSRIMNIHRAEPGILSSEEGG